MKFEVGDRVFHKLYNKIGLVVWIDEEDNTCPYLILLGEEQGYHCGHEFTPSSLVNSLEEVHGDYCCVWGSDETMEASF